MDAAKVIDDVLYHHGTKGMKWGVRKAVHPAIAHIPKKIRKEAAADAEEFTRAKLFFGEGAGTRRKLINAKVESKKAKDKLYAKAFDHFVKKTDLGRRATQARQQRRRKDTGKQVKKLAKKASPFLTNLLVNDLAPHSYGDRTRRFGLDHSNKLVTQSELFVDDILTHHGIKGMKWGIRKRAGRAGPQDVTVKPTLTRRSIKTKGGEGHPAHPDAVRARTIGQVGKKSGLAALSNKDLQDYAQRLNLEANANRLSYGEKSGPVKFVKRVLGQSGEQAITAEANKVASHQVKKHLTKRLVKIGATAAVA